MAERSGDLWASFQHDPRDPAVAPLRASDADRNVVHSVLTEAFADGRLDREEYDERTAAALQARTLGQLPALVADLVPDRPLLPSSSRVPLVAASNVDLQQRAEEKWREDRRHAFMGFVGSGLLTWAIWIATAWGDWNIFPWPLDRERLRAHELPSGEPPTRARSWAPRSSGWSASRPRSIQSQNKKQFGP